MPGDAWPCRKTWSPIWDDAPAPLPPWPDSTRPLKNQLKPTSKSVADEANVEMWPPIPSLLRLARTTIAIAFQRTRPLTMGGEYCSGFDFLRPTAERRSAHDAASPGWTDRRPAALDVRGGLLQRWFLQ